MTDPNLGFRLEKCYSGAVYDVLRALGHPECVLPSTIRPLDPQRRLAGRVWTLEGGLKEDLSEHETLLEWTGFLSRAPSGSVVICQPNDHTVSHMGELSSETLQLRGVKGYIVDGGARDSGFIYDIGFRLFCSYYTPKDVVARWVPTGYEVPIVIGGVTIHTGDYVVADRDGIVIIPGELAEQVTEEAENVMRTESLVRKAILGGMDPQAAYLKYGKF